MNRMRWILTLVGLLLVGSVAAFGCNFYFSYDEIVAPLGVVGEIGVQVQKTHNNCPEDLDDYHFESVGIQILGETEWVEVARDTYEKWFSVSLAEEGEGYLKIWKNCTKEGYEEAVLPITVTSATDGTSWAQALSGTYPFDIDGSADVDSVFGTASVSGTTLSVDGVSVVLPVVPTELSSWGGDVRLFYDADFRAWMVVSDTFLYRFDHLI